ncbi:hypothetical protein [Methyloversatilis sp.]|uniref:hypothetical protein n=1 Tax=Methyloversatilis sp. TaxID=2569862 RepID=UPI0035B3A487
MHEAPVEFEPDATGMAAHPAGLFDRRTLVASGTGTVRIGALGAASEVALGRR